MKPRWRPPVHADLAATALFGTVAVSATAASAATPTILCRAAVTPGSINRQLFVNGARAQRARGSIDAAGFSRSDSSFVNTSDPWYAAFGNASQVEVVDNNAWKRLRCNTDEGAIGVAPDGTTRSSVNAQAVRRHAGHNVFPINARPLGRHTLRLIKQSGQYLGIDQFDIS